MSTMRIVSAAAGSRSSLLCLLALSLVFLLGTTATADLINPGDLLVTVGSVGMSGDAGVIAVDPKTGKQTIVSMNDNLLQPQAIIVGANGNIYVADQLASNGGAIIRIDPMTGKQTVVSKDDNFSNGPLGMALDADGNLIVGDSGARKILRIDPQTGKQTVITMTDFNPLGLRVGPSGDIVVADAIDKEIIRIDPKTGKQTVISQGNMLTAGLADVAIEANGDILASDSGSKSIIRIDPIFNIQTNVSQGGKLLGPLGLTVGMGSIFVADFQDIS